MAKGLYFDVSGIIKRIRKIFFGINGTPHKAKKIYFGVDGAPRLAWSSAELSRYGLLTGLSLDRYGVGSANNGAYAVFAGGGQAYGDPTNGYTYPVYSNVDYYNASLVKGGPTYLASSRVLYANGARVGNYAIFGTGADSYGIAPGCDAFDQSMVRTNPTNDDGYGGQVAFGNSLTNPTFAIMGFGYFGNYYSGYTLQYQSVFYNESLVKGYAAGYDGGKCSVGVACVGGYIIVAGGDTVPNTWYGDNHDVLANVYVYNSSYVRTEIAGMSTAKASPCAICNDAYAFFFGGNPSTTIVDAYNTSLVKSTPTAMPGGQTADFNNVSHPEFAMAFVNYGQPVVAYDTSGMQVTAPTMADGHCRGTIIGDYMVFAGGTGSQTTTAEAYNTAG